MDIVKQKNWEVMYCPDHISMFSACLPVFTCVGGACEGLPVCAGACAEASSPVWPTVAGVSGAAAAPGGCRCAVEPSAGGKS